MRSFVSAGIIILVIIFAAVYAVSERDTGHVDFKMECTNCHISEPEDSANPGMMIFVRDVNLICMDCHDIKKKASHPIGVIPSFDVPKGFPLDWQGRNTCVTCHAVHKEGYGRYILRSEKRGKAFCIICHGKNLEEGIGLHKGMVGSAHFGSRYVILDKGVIIDELSTLCLSCHDAQFGKDVPINIGRGLFSHSSTVGITHPIGANYAMAVANDERYVQPFNLPSEIKLFAGRIGCGTCHNPYSDNHSQLVISNRRSALCLACHIK